MRLLAEGSPSVLIEGGKVLEDNLAKNKITLDSLNQALRQKEVLISMKSNTPCLRLTDKFQS